MNSSYSSNYPSNWQVANARELSKTELSTDVVIVGTGAGGAITAEILAASGLKVIMLEEGPYRSQADFNMQEQKAYPDLYQEASARRTKDKAISILQGRAVGGSTTVNWTASFRTPKQTLDYWQSEFGLSDLTDTKLAPWFERMEQRLNIKPWAVAPNENNNVLLQGARRLGYHAEVIPRNVKGCANLGYCGVGCPIDAKQSMLVTAIPSALANGAQLIARAKVERLTVKTDQVQSLQVTALDKYGQPIISKGLTIRAKHVVLSAGAIGSPAILLKSGINANKRVGSRTFLHPVTATVAFMKQKVAAYQGAPQSIYSDEFLWRDGVSGEMGYKLEVPPIHPLLASTIAPGHASEHQAFMDKFTNISAMLALHRDGFNEQSTGGQVEIDSNGLPVLDYQLTKEFFETAKHSLLNMAEMQFAAGAEQVGPIHADAKPVSTMSKYKQQLAKLDIGRLKLKVFSAHVMGGCQMGNEPSKSVVNSFGEHHQLGNLSVIDGSIFPTSLGVNPQLTIYALAARAATNLVDTLEHKL